MSEYDTSKITIAQEKINEYRKLVKKKNELEKSILIKKKEISNAKKPLLLTKNKFEKQLEEKQNEIVKLENEESMISQQIVSKEEDYLKLNEIIFDGLNQICASSMTEDGSEKIIDGRALMPLFSAFLEKTGLHYYEASKYISEKYSLDLYKPIVWYLLYKYREGEDVQETGKELKKLHNEGKIDFDEAGKYIAELGNVSYGAILPALCKYI